MLRWTWVGLFTLFIYATLPVGRQAWRWFSGTSAFWSDNFAVAGLLLVGVWVAWAGLRRADIAPRSWLAGISIAVAYAICLRLINLTPAEKTHFLYYGFLGFLVYRAMRQHLHGGALYVGVIAMVAAIGLGDELIQYALPGRFFEWKDVGLNAIAGTLALAVVAVFDPGGPEPPR